MLALRNTFQGCRTPSFVSEDKTGDLPDMEVVAHAKVKFETVIQWMQCLDAEAGYVDD